MNIRISEDNNTTIEEGTAITGGQTFDGFASELPEDARSGFGVVQTPSDEGIAAAGEEGQTVTEPKTVQIKMSKKMKAAMKKIQEKVASYPLLYFRQKATVHPEWKLDPDEEEIITDSLEFVFQVLNIEFQIESLDITLRSIWWVIAYPIMAIGMIFVAHKTASDAAHPEDNKKEE